MTAIVTTAMSALRSTWPPPKMAKTPHSLVFLMHQLCGRAFVWPTLTASSPARYCQLAGELSLLFQLGSCVSTRDASNPDASPVIRDQPHHRRAPRGRIHRRTENRRLLPTRRRGRSRQSSPGRRPRRRPRRQGRSQGRGRRRGGSRVRARTPRVLLVGRRARDHAGMPEECLLRPVSVADELVDVERGRAGVHRRHAQGDRRPVRRDKDEDGAIAHLPIV